MGGTVTALVRSIAHGITNQATTEMIAARAAITMIAHKVTQIANGTRFRCMFPPKSRRNWNSISALIPRWGLEKWEGNQSMRHSLAGSILLMLCADAGAQPQGDWAADPVQTLTECGRSDGYAYYFPGGLVPADKSGLRKDGIDGGRIILDYTGDEVDLLIKNATGTTKSVKQDGGKLILRNSNNGLIAMTVIYEVGTLTEDYVFQLDDRGNGTVAWTAIRTAGNINKMALFTAQCRSPR
jgi:hypothetical protein